MSQDGLKRLKPGKTPRWGFWIVTGMVLLYVLVMGYYSILRYQAFEANAFDMGLMLQTIWNTSQGDILEESINIGRPVSRILVAHWEFIYLPLALLYKVFQSPEMLLLMQTLVLALGAYAVYGLALDRLGHILSALALAAAYLLYPASQNVNLCDIHGLAFSTSLLLFTFYFLQRSNRKMFVLFAFLTLACREDLALILFMFGIYSLVILKQRKLGFGVTILSLVWFFAFFKRATIQSMLGIPLIEFHTNTPSHWEHLGATLTNPLYLIKFLAKKYNIYYIIDLFGPVGFLSFLSPATLILMAPTFLINILSDWYFAHGIRHVYTATITPIVFISAIYGLENLKNGWENRKKRAKSKVTTGLKHPLVLASIGVILLALYFQKTRSNVYAVAKYQITEHHRIAARIIAQIPENASLSADVYLCSHAAARREIYVFPDNAATADYVLYDFHADRFHLYTREAFHLEHHRPVNPFIQKVLHDQNKGIVHYDDGIIVFKKGADYQAGIEKLAWASPTEVPVACTIPLTPNIALVGYGLPQVTPIWFPDSSAANYIRWEKVVRLELFWQAESTLVEAPEFQYVLANSHAQYKFSQVPVLGLYPITQWKPHQIIRDELFINLPPTLPAGEYSLAVIRPLPAVASSVLKNEVELLKFKID